MVKIETLIIDNDIDVRMRLKQATCAVPIFGKLHHATTLAHALDLLNSDTRCDVIFISNKFCEAEIETFVASAKEAPGAQDAAFVLAIEKNGMSNAGVAMKMIGGVDGLLFEPYSVDELSNITILASRIKKERAVEREIRSLRFLMKDVIAHVDLLSRLTRRGYHTESVREKLQSLSMTIRELEPQARQAYLQLSLDAFTSVPIPNWDASTDPFERYAGCSERVKQRLTKRALRSLQQ